MQGAVAVTTLVQTSVLLEAESTLLERIPQNLQSKNMAASADSHTQYFSAAGSKQTKYGSNGLAILETEHTSLMRSLLEIKVEGVLQRTVFNNKILNDKHRLLKIRRAILRKAF